MHDPVCLKWTKVFISVLKLFIHHLKVVGNWVTHEQSAHTTDSYNVQTVLNVFGHVKQLNSLTKGIFFLQRLCRLVWMSGMPLCTHPHRVCARLPRHQNHELAYTYGDIYIDVWSQACQSIHIDVMVTELWGGGPGGCAGGGGSCWGWGRSCKWNKVSCWTQNANLIKITRKPDWKANINKKETHKTKLFKEWSQ